MFNFLSKSTHYPEPQYSEVITKVHNDFNSAGDRLYEEAIRIINSTHVNNLNKVEKLKKLGFVSAKEVIETETMISLKTLSATTSEIIRYYKKNYPNNKFISDDQVKEICTKYGLVYGEIKLYTGFIPTANIPQIEAFKCKNKDESKGYGSISTYGSNKGQIEWDNGVNARAWGGIYSRIGINKGFYIAAPQKDFDMKNREIQNFRIVNVPVPDPVVLYAVKHGYLIVTAWGDEASDPLIK
jgi:hypothetical protein